MKKKVFARAPLRISFAGGGTDLPQYSSEFGGCVVNATINKYAYTQIEVNEENFLELNSIDLNKNVTISLNDNIPAFNDCLPLHLRTYLEIIKKIKITKLPSLKISTLCEAPIGSGLGASSTIVVSMIKAFDLFFGLSLTKSEIAQLAFDIERIHCKMKGGKQDQFSASFGGFNQFDFLKNGTTKVNRVKVNEALKLNLEQSLILYFTGKSRHSHEIIASQDQNIKNKNNSAIQAMHELKNIAIKMKDFLESGNLNAIINSLNHGWEIKQKTGDLISTHEINEILSSIKDKGALSAKISGAGGGGFILFYVPLIKKEIVKKSLSTFGGMFSNCLFTDSGAQSWKI